MKDMKKINITKLTRHISVNYFTMNNAVIAVALIIGASWAWGSIGVMQRNYALQKTIDTKTRQQTLAQLELDTLKYEQKYYQSSEYKEVAARKYLGLVNAGEKVLVLPPNSASAKQADLALSTKPIRNAATPPSNFQQWTSFLFGGNRSSLQK